MKRTLAMPAAGVLLVATGATALAGSIGSGDRLEMAAVLKAPITPTRAVKIAERGGGHAYGFGMEANRHGYWYEVDVLRGDANLELRIDAATGKVMRSSAARGEDVQGSHALDGSKLAFGEAVAQAERAGKGPALEANATGHGERAHVDVDIIQYQGKRIAHYRVWVQGGRLHAALTGTDT
jgi:hypothetical protein